MTNEEQWDEDEQDAIADALAMERALQAYRGADGGAQQDTPPVATEGTAPAPHPYATLTPERVLDAIESIGERCDGRLLTLNSYENRVYLVGLDDGSQCVAKFYRPERWTDAQILEEHRFVDALAAREVPVVPARIDEAGASLHSHDGFRFALFDRRGGRAPEIESRDTREWLGRFIGRIHALGAATNYIERPALDITTFGFESRDWIVAHRIVPAPLDAVWVGVVGQALAAVAACEVLAGPSQLLRLHGDCHVGNILWTEGDGARIGGPHFVDFDDSRTGPALQDLWMLLSGTRDDMTRQLADLLNGYRQFNAFDVRELHRLEALRTLRMIHYSAWLARRWDDPAFPAAFPWFGSEHYWQNQILALREQIAAMEEPALRP
ncbi:MAG: serine/threonine protein kinase [Burkholderiaceae bacterium]